MNEQMPIDFAGQRLAEEGMQRTLEAEREEWLRHAVSSLQAFVALPAWREFKFEDFRYWYLTHGGSEPHDHHVWGALTNRARLAGFIRSTGRFAPSVSPKTHGHPVRVWCAVFAWDAV